MSGHKLADGEGFVDTGRNFSVFCSSSCNRKSINISTEDENNRSLDVSIEASKLAEASAKVSIEKSREGEITYKGDKSIAFGIELYQLDYDNTNRIFKFHEVTNTVTPYQGSSVQVRLYGSHVCKCA